jgi:hypothetical protein
MSIKQLQPVILMVSISFLATPLTSCGRNAQTTTDSPPAQAVTGTESPDPSASDSPSVQAVTGASEAPDDPSAAAPAQC